MDTQASVSKFLEFILGESNNQPDLGELIEQLDYLSVASHLDNFEFDENDYPEPPEKNYSGIRKIIERKFPDIGLYSSVDSEVSEIDSAEVVLGDAFDDLVDIVGDLKDVQWYFDNTSSNNALWHFQSSYRSHWGLHLKELQLFLHRQWW